MRNGDGIRNGDAPGFHRAESKGTRILTTVGRPPTGWSGPPGRGPVADGRSPEGPRKVTHTRPDRLGARSGRLLGEFGGRRQLCGASFFGSPWPAVPPQGQ